MADIKQAAVWMRLGKSVRRSIWPTGDLLVYTGEATSTSMAYVITSKKHPFAKVPSAQDISLKLESILADDWEIAE